MVFYNCQAFTSHSRTMLFNCRPYMHVRSALYTAVPSNPQYIRIFGHAFRFVALIVHLLLTTTVPDTITMDTLSS